jgi:hypothetical protein
VERLAKAVADFGCKVDYIPARELRATGERIHWQLHGVDLDGTIEPFTKVLGSDSLSASATVIA